MENGLSLPRTRGAHPGEKMIKAVLFDVDGTLGDTLALCIAAFRESIGVLSGAVVSDEELKATFGPSEEHTISVFLPDRYAEGVALYHERYKALHGMCPEPFGGIRELLEFLRGRGVFLGVVTGKGAKSAEMTFDQYGLSGFFSDVETGRPERASKAPGIRRILERRGLKPEEAVYVGDAPSDVVSAREGGVGMLAVSYASTADAGELAAMKPDELFHSVAEMRAYFEKILG